MFVRFSDLHGSLLDDFRRLHQAFDDVLSDNASARGGIRSLPRGSFPAINVLQTPSDIRVYVFAPGVDPKELNISIQQGLLTIAGKRSLVLDDNATYYRQERFSGEFSRAVGLGDEVDADRVEATYRDGIVQIKLQRRESTKPRQIEIN